MLTQLLMSARVWMVHSPSTILSEALASASTFVTQLKRFICQAEG